MLHPPSAANLPLTLLLLLLLRCTCCRSFDVISAVMSTTFDRWEKCWSHFRVGQPTTNRISHCLRLLSHWSKQPTSANELTCVAFFSVAPGSLSTSHRDFNCVHTSHQRTKLASRDKVSYEHTKRQRNNHPGSSSN